MPFPFLWLTPVLKTCASTYKHTDTHPGALSPASFLAPRPRSAWPSTSREQRRHVAPKRRQCFVFAAKSIGEGGLGSNTNVLSCMVEESVGLLWSLNWTVAVFTFPPTEFHSSFLFCLERQVASLLVCISWRLLYSCTLNNKVVRALFNDGLSSSHQLVNADLRQGGGVYVDVGRWKWVDVSPRNPFECWSLLTQFLWVAHSPFSLCVLYLRLPDFFFLLSRIHKYGMMWLNTPIQAVGPSSPTRCFFEETWVCRTWTLWWRNCSLLWTWSTLTLTVSANYLYLLYTYM